MRIKLAAGALILAPMIHAATPIDGWYTSSFGGFAYTPGNVNNTTAGLTRNNVGYQSGFDAGGGLGFKSNPLRYEFEVTYLNTKVAHFDINGVRQARPSGYNQDLFGMANVYYDFAGILPMLEPFLGVGIGYGWVQAKLNSLETSGLIDFTGGNSVFAYQATAGITYNFAENYALTLGYRYIATTNVTQLNNIFQAHMANAGVIYRFDGSNYK